MKKEKIYLKMYLNKKDGRIYMIFIDKNGKLYDSEITDSIPALINADDETLEGVVELVKPIMELLMPSMKDEANIKDVDIVQIYYYRKKFNKFSEYFN